MPPKRVESAAKKYVRQAAIERNEPINAGSVHKIRARAWVLYRLQVPTLNPRQRATFQQGLNLAFADAAFMSGLRTAVDMDIGSVGGGAGGAGDPQKPKKIAHKDRSEKQKPGLPPFSAKKRKTKDVRAAEPAFEFQSPLKERPPFANQPSHQRSSQPARGSLKKKVSPTKSGKDERYPPHTGVQNITGLTGQSSSSGHISDNSARVDTAPGAEEPNAEIVALPTSNIPAYTAAALGILAINHGKGDGKGGKADAAVLAAAVVGSAVVNSIAESTGLAPVPIGGTDAFAHVPTAYPTDTTPGQGSGSGGGGGPPGDPRRGGGLLLVLYRQGERGGRDPSLR